MVDLGAGEGALAKAALNEHPRARALFVEMDKRVARTLSKHLPARASVVCADALGSAWKAGDAPSWILSNPPYGYTALTAPIQSMLDESGLPVPVSGDWVRGDAAFLARAWGLAGVDTSIGLIVASPMIREGAFQSMRMRLVAQLSGLCVTQLEESTFANTEVRAYLLSGRRAVSRRRNVLLRKADAKGVVIDEMEVGFAAAVHSLDIDYHRMLARFEMTERHGVDTLGGIGVSIVRGSRSNRDFERLGLRAFHTTDFNGASSEIHLQGALSGYQVARPGDILIPRVGSRCLVRQTRVNNGEGLFTDCVYRLTMSERDRTRVWKTLTSSFGAEWRLANAAGSCAKHLTVRTLSTMPLVA